MTDEPIEDDGMPTYTEVIEKIKAGTANALDRFIYDNEPAGQTETRQFRKGLTDVINAANLERIKALESALTKMLFLHGARNKEEIDAEADARLALRRNKSC
jgi:hypothetical protein